MIGFSLAEEGALLVGGPEAGQVVRVRKTEDTIVVKEEVELGLLRENDGPIIHGVGGRTGVYRRQGNSSNFFWQGWA